MRLPVWSAVLAMGALLSGATPALSGIPKAGPTAFAFGTLTDREFDVWAVSATRTISGLSETVPISISGEPTAQYRIGNGAWTKAAGSIANGKTLTLRLRTAASGNVVRTATIKVGDYSTGFTARTYATLPKTSDTVSDFISGGRTRSFIVDAPQSGSTTGLSLILALHGDGDSAEGIRRTMNFAKLFSATNRFVVIYPQALAINGYPQFNKYADQRPGYSEPANSDYDASAADDVRFLSDLIDYAARVYAIDRQKVYLTGFSGGGFMAYHYAVAAPRRLAAIAPVAASLYGDFASGYLPNYFEQGFVDVPLLQLHGLDDNVVEPPSAAANNGDGNVDYPVGTFAASTCADLTPTVTVDGRARTRTYCASKPQVKWVGIQGLDHRWPTQTRGYDATANIWRFFKAQRRACEGSPLRVSGRDVLDACDQPIQFRGINYPAYKSGYDPNENLIPEIAGTGANAVRIVWWIDNPDVRTDQSFTAAKLDAAITAAYDAGLVPIVSIPDLTCNRRPLSDLNALVVPWATSAPYKAVLLKHQDHLILNLANEAGLMRWGEGTLASKQTAFRQAYSTAIQSLRNAGLSMPLIVDAADCGQSLSELVTVADQIKAADRTTRVTPARIYNNIIFSAHAYWANYANTGTKAGQKLRAATATAGAASQPRDFPLLLGELANLQDSGTGEDICDLPLPYADYIDEALRYGVGWLIWSWHEDFCPVRMMTTSPSTLDDLNAYGTDLTENTRYGFMRAVPVTLPPAP